MSSRDQISRGMTVRTSDGHRLGRVTACGVGEFHIAKGVFFREDYLATYDMVDEVRGDEIILFANRQAMLAADSSSALAAQKRRGEERPVIPFSALDTDEEEWRPGTEAPSGQRSYGVPREPYGELRSYASPERQHHLRGPEHGRSEHDEGEHTAWRLPEGDDKTHY